MVRERLLPIQRGYSDGFLRYLQSDLGMTDSQIQLESSDDLRKVFSWWFSWKGDAKKLSTLPSMNQLASACQEIRKLLDNHHGFILKTGLTPEIYRSDELLNAFFCRFCDTKVTSSPFPIDVVGVEDTFKFLKVVVNDKGCVLSREVVPYDQASYIHKLDYCDIDFLDKTRPKMISLAMSLIDVASDALVANQESLAFYKMVVDRITLNLTVDEFLTLVDIESKFRKTRPSKDDFRFNGNSTLGGDGILNSLLGFVAYVARVLVFRVSETEKVELQRILNKSSFEALVGLEPPLRVEAFSSSQQEFTEGYLSFLEDLDCWVEGQPRLSRLVRKLGVKEPEDSSEPSRIFRRVSSGGTVTWEFGFNGKIMSSSDRSGFYYIQSLLKNPGKVFSRLELDSLKNILEMLPIDPDLVSSGGVAPGDMGGSTRSLEISLRNLEKQKDEATTNRLIDIENAIALIKSKIVENNEVRRESKNIINKVGQSIARMKDWFKERFPELGAYLDKTVRIDFNGGVAYIPEDSSKHWLTVSK